MEAHWTERSVEDYRFRIVADFIAQIEEKMETEHINQDELAKSFGKSKSRISQILNNPGNITFDSIVKLARAINLKVSLVAYNDDDPRNTKGPINSEIFKICWEKQGKPHDFWSLKTDDSTMKTANSAVYKADNFSKYVDMGSFDKINISKTVIFDDSTINVMDEPLNNVGYGG